MAERPNWKPWQVNPFFLGSLLAMAIAMVAVLELLAQKSTAIPSANELRYAWLAWYAQTPNNAAGDLLNMDWTFHDPGACLEGLMNLRGISSGYYFAWTYLPSIIAILYAIVWGLVDAEVKRVEPFYQMSQPAGVKAGESIFADYLRLPAILSPLQAIRRKQWVVVLSAFTFILINTITPILQSQMFQIQVQVLRVGYMDGYGNPYYFQNSLISGNDYAQYQRIGNNAPLFATCKVVGVDWAGLDSPSIGDVVSEDTALEATGFYQGALRSVMYLSPTVARGQEVVLILAIIIGAALAYKLAARRSGMTTSYASLVTLASISNVFPDFLRQLSSTMDLDQAKAREAERYLSSQVVRLGYRSQNPTQLASHPPSRSWPQPTYASQSCNDSTAQLNQQYGQSPQVNQGWNVPIQANHDWTSLMQPNHAMPMQVEQSWSQPTPIYQSGSQFAPSSQPWSQVGQSYKPLNQAGHPNYTLEQPYDARSLDPKQLCMQSTQSIASDQPWVDSGHTAGRYGLWFDNFSGQPANNLQPGDTRKFQQFGRVQWAMILTCGLSFIVMLISLTTGGFQVKGNDLSDAVSHSAMPTISLVLAAILKSLWNMVERNMIALAPFRWRADNTYKIKPRLKAAPVFNREYARMPPGWVSVVAFKDGQIMLGVVTFLSFCLEVAVLLLAIASAMTQGQGFNSHTLPRLCWTTAAVLIVVSFFAWFASVRVPRAYPNLLSAQGSTTSLLAQISRSDALLADMQPIGEHKNSRTRDQWLAQLPGQYCLGKVRAPGLTMDVTYCLEKTDACIP